MNAATCAEWIETTLPAGPDVDVWLLVVDGVIEGWSFGEKPPTPGPDWWPVPHLNRGGLEKAIHSVLETRIDHLSREKVKATNAARRKARAS